ncbi:TonB-dependent siderophore receptor [Rhizomicrobium palustre]
MAAGICAVAANAEGAAKTEGVETVTVTGQSINLDVKGHTPLLETPQNIQILSADLLASQNVTRLDEALRNVAGVMGGGYYQSYDYFRIRGFDASGFIYLDGMRLDSYVDVNAEISGLEQIQVVKGPASALYGQGALGGLVNFVSKRPTRDAFLNVSAAYGSFDSYELSLDGNRPITGDVAARLVATWRQAGSFADHSSGDNRIYVAPSVTWDIDADTSVTLLSSYQHDKFNMVMPLTALGTITPSKYGTYSLKTYTGNLGDDNHSWVNRTQLGYQASHRFNDVFTLNHRLRYTVNDQRWNKILYTSSLVDTGSTLALSQYPYDYDSFGTMITTDTSLSADFTTGPLRHQVMIGTDYAITHSHSHSGQIDYADPNSYVVIDLFHPTYHKPMPVYKSFASAHESLNTLGTYVQDHITYGDFTLTASLRWDDAHSISGGADKTDVAYTPRLGLTYAVMPDAVLFASYSESFLPQSGTLFSGEPLKPETGRQWETGVKASLLDGHIDLSASLYYLTRNNVATSDPTHPFSSIQSGKQRSRGFEFDSRFNIVENWQAIFTYAYTDAVVIEDNTYPVGDQLSNVPKNSIGLWSRYAFDGALNGLSVNGGVYYYSSMAGDLPNTFRLPSYTLANAGIAYDYGDATLQLSFKNLFNERYFSGSYNDVYVQPGATRSIEARLSYRL